VEAAGGWIVDGRVCNILAVSRAFGDPEFKVRNVLAPAATKSCVRVSAWRASSCCHWGLAGGGGLKCVLVPASVLGWGTCVPVILLAWFSMSGRKHHASQACTTQFPPVSASLTTIKWGRGVSNIRLAVLLGVLCHGVL
jgi:hypothetical protein